MNELKIFNNNQFGSIRTTVINNEPSPKGVGTTDILTSGGLPKATFINESNLC